MSIQDNFQQRYSKLNTFLEEAEDGLTRIDQVTTAANVSLLTNSVNNLQLNTNGHNENPRNSDDLAIEHAVHYATEFMFDLKVYYDLFMQLKNDADLIQEKIYWLKVYGKFDENAVQEYENAITLWNERYDNIAAHIIGAFSDHV